MIMIMIITKIATKIMTISTIEEKEEKYYY
jgi:hypothetical protein